MMVPCTDAYDFTFGKGEKLWTEFVFKVVETKLTVFI